MYESFYHLRAKPFQLSPDPRFFFNSKGHRRALAYLRYGVKQGEGFIIITGDVGTGKTTLVSALFRAIKGEDLVAAQVVTTQLQADDLVRMVAAAFGLPYERVGKTSLLRHLEEYFRACAQEGKRLLLVVDEAQNLPRAAIEELRMLSNFQWNNRPLLQSFLLGQREFRVTIRSEGFEQLRQRVIAAYHLDPLDPDETRNYVEHRLLTAGWRGDPQLTDDIFPEIYRFTGGVPRRINTLCDRLLLYGYLEERHGLDGEALRAVSHDITEEGSGPVSQPLDGDAHQGWDPLPGAGRESSQEAPMLAHQRAGAGAEPPSGEDRLGRLEQSVAALAEAVREEVALLRELVIQTRNNGRDDEGS
jgi:general secretion pathway protein A